MKSSKFLLLCFTAILLGNGPAGAYTEISGNLSGSLGEGTYLVTGSLTVPENDTLAVEAGAVLKFQPGTRLTCQGTLQAGGISANPVIFTSRNDNTAGEVVPGSSGNPQPGNWLGILFDGSGTYPGRAQLQWVEVRYGETPTGTSARESG